MIAVVGAALLWSRTHQIHDGVLAPRAVEKTEAPAATTQPDAREKNKNAAKPNAVAETKTITIRPGTRLSVRLAERIGTDRNRTGDVFRATLASPIVESGMVIADAGARVMGRVVEAHKAPLLHGRANLSLAVSSVETREDGAVRVRTAAWEERGAHEKVINTARRTVVLPAGTEIGFVVTAPLKVRMKIR